MSSDLSGIDAHEDRMESAAASLVVPVCEHPPVISDPPKRVLVTGANGFVGSHLVRALIARGDDVTCLVRRESRLNRLEDLEVRICHGDVTDLPSVKAAVSGHDIVYHVAGVAASGGLKRLYDVNELGTRHVAEACATPATPPVLLLVSSMAASGPSLRNRPRVETQPPRPVSHYGRSKLAGEHAVAAFAQRLPISIVRPPIVLGEADKLGLPLYAMIWRFRLHMMVGLGRHRYSIVHADDLVQLLILAAVRGKRLCGGDEPDPACQGYYFAACDTTPTYAELGRLVAAAMQRRLLLIPSPPRAIWPVEAVQELWGHLSGRQGVMHLDKVREVRSGSWVCSAQRAVEELGYCVRANLPDRLRQTVQWYRQEGWL